MVIENTSFLNIPNDGIWMDEMRSGVSREYA